MILPPAAAKYYFERHIIFEISLREISKMMCLWGCVKRFLPPSAAEFSFERHLIFTISLREIVKMRCLSKDNLVRSAMKNFFTQPQYYFERHVIFMISLREIMKMTCLSKHNSARSAVKNLFTQPQYKISPPKAANSANLLDDGRHIGFE